MAKESTAVNDLIDLVSRRPLRQDPEDELFAAPAVTLRAPVPPIAAPRHRMPRATPAIAPVMPTDDEATELRAPPEQDAATMPVRRVLPAEVERRPAYLADAVTTYIARQPARVHYTQLKFVLPAALIVVAVVSIGGFLAFGGRDTTPVAAIAAIAPPPPPVVAPAPPPVKLTVTPIAVREPTIVAVAPAVEPVPAAVPEAVAAPAPAPPTKHAKRSTKRTKRATTTKRPTRQVADAPATVVAAAAGTKPTGPGKLAITSNRPALIYVDGRSIGVSTPRTITVPSGPHKITLLDAQTHKAKTSNVEVVAGKSVKLDRTFE